jgi:hypothetical protein
VRLESEQDAPAGNAARRPGIAAIPPGGAVVVHQRELAATRAGFAANSAAWRNLASAFRDRLVGRRL